MSRLNSRRNVRNLTIVTDLVLVNLAFAAAYLARYEWQWLRPPEFSIPYGDYIEQQLVLTLLVAIAFSQNKVWTRRRGEFLVDEVSRLTYAAAAAIALLVAITWFVRPLAFSRLMLFWALLFIVGALALARLLRRLLLGVLYARGVGVDRVLVVGSSEVARGVMRTLLARTDLGYKAVGYLDDGTSGNNLGSARVPHLGHWTELETVLATHPQLRAVFIAMPSELHDAVTRLVEICRVHGIRAEVVPDLFQMSLNRVEFTNLSGLPLLSVRDVNPSQWALLTKRALDLTLVIVGALPAALLAAIIALAIKLDSPGPVLFIQERMGLNGRCFKMIKFRSMVVDADDQKSTLQAMNEADGPIFKIRDDPRLTRVGRTIRRLSLDELPQLYNIFRGDMSFVGPRPSLPSEIAEYQPWHRRRLEVKGGLTGLWQVSGRSDLTFDEQCLLDIYYIENWSLALDLRILLQTIPFALFGRGAY